MIHLFIENAYLGYFSFNQDFWKVEPVIFVWIKSDRPGEVAIIPVLARKDCVALA